MALSVEFLLKTDGNLFVTSCRATAWAFSGFWFLVCYAAAQLATQLQPIPLGVTFSKAQSSNVSFATFQ